MSADHVDLSRSGQHTRSRLNLIDRFEKGVRALAEQCQDDAVVREELRLAAAHLRNATNHIVLSEYERMEAEERARDMEANGKP
jgi:hypothetical protein